ILFSIFQTQELEISLNDIKSMINGISDKEIELMLFYLDENGLIQKNKYADEPLIRLTYQSNFALMLLENHLKEFTSFLASLNTDFVARGDESLEEIYKSFWNWWFERLAGAKSFNRLIKTCNRAKNLWRGSELNEKYWKSVILESKTELVYEIAMLLLENDNFQGDGLIWLTTEDWERSFKARELAADLSELSYSSDSDVDFFVNWSNYDKLSFQNHCLEILQSQEWFYEPSYVEDPGGDGFEPGSAYIPGGISWSIKSIIQLLKESCGGEWVNLASTLINLLVYEKEDYTTFLAFLTLLDDSTLARLDVNRLPDAKKLISIDESYLDDFARLEDIYEKLDIWAGPKVEEIAEKSLDDYLEQLSKHLKEDREEKKNYYRDHIDKWFDFIPFNCLEKAATFYKEHAELIMKKIDYDDLDIILSLIQKWDSDYLENIWTGEFFRKLNRIHQFNMRKVKGTKICQSLLSLTASEFIQSIESNTFLLPFISRNILIEYIQSNPTIQWLKFLRTLEEEIEKPIFSGFCIYSDSITIKEATTLKNTVKTICNDAKYEILARGMEFYLDSIRDLIESEIKSSTSPRGIIFYSTRELLDLIDHYFPKFNSNNELVYQWFLNFITNQQYSSIVKELLQYMIANRKLARMAIRMLINNYRYFKSITGVDSFHFRHDLSDGGKKELVSHMIGNFDFLTVLAEKLASIFNSVLNEYIEGYLSNKNSAIDLLDRIIASSISNSDKIIEKLLSNENFLLNLLADTDINEASRETTKSLFNNLDTDILLRLFRTREKQTKVKILQLVSREKVIKLVEELPNYRNDTVPLIFYHYPDGLAVVKELIDFWKEKADQKDIDDLVFRLIDTWKTKDYPVADIVKQIEPLIAELEFAKIPSKIDSLKEIIHLPVVREKIRKNTLKWFIEKSYLSDEIIELWENSLGEDVTDLFRKQSLQIKEKAVERLIRFDWSYRDISQKDVESMTKILESPLRAELYAKYFYRGLYEQNSDIIKKLSSLNQLDPAIKTMFTKIEANVAILLLTLVRERENSIFTNRYQEYVTRGNEHADVEFLALLAFSFDDVKIRSIINHILTQIYTPAKIGRFIAKFSRFSDNSFLLLARYDLDGIIASLLRDENEFISLLLDSYTTGSKD
ncbi:MAG: hypothetical protein ACFFD4_28455, partial [Candidatus Odinarchaeota archaeon]